MSIKISFTGDIFPANLPYTIGFGVGSMFEKHQGKPWISPIIKQFQDKDIVFGNIESPLVNNKIERDTKPFAGSPNFPEFLKKVGFNILNVANNHILQYGDVPFDNTIKVLNKNNMKVVGLSRNGNTNIVTYSFGDLNIAVAGFNDIHDHHNDRYAVLSKEEILKVLEAMKSDIKIISLHWGAEYVMFPSPKQIRFARMLIDAGADIIVGHHPHVIQPVEKYKKGIICYSLGNFMFDMHWSKKLREGIVLEIEINDMKEITYNVIFIEIDKEYTPRVVLNASKNKIRLGKYYAKMLKYEKMGEVGERRYKLLTNRLRNIERIKSKFFWIRNLHKQPIFVRKQNMLNVKNKLIQKLKNESK